MIEGSGVVTGDGMDAKQELTPGGELRVGLNYGNSLLVLKDAPDGPPRAIAPDVGFLGAEPQRANEIAFTKAYLEIPVTFLVPAGSKINSIADVDRKGVRISVSARSAYDLYLSRTLKNAELVRVEGIDASYELFVRDKLDVLAGLKPRLVSDADKLPGSRVLDGQATGVQQAAGTKKTKAAGAQYLSQFIDEIKRSGLVAQTIEKHGVRGVTVAP